MKTYKGKILKRADIPENGVFVFGSNTEGRHGKGAAKIALDHFGAIYGESNGPQGESYAIITKDLTKREHPSVPKIWIKAQIQALYFFAEFHKKLDFYVAYGIGPNLNAYSPQEMAEMFSSFPLPENIVFEEQFAELIKANL